MIIYSPALFPLEGSRAIRWEWDIVVQGNGKEVRSNQVAPIPTSPVSPSVHLSRAQAGAAQHQKDSIPNLSFHDITIFLGRAGAPAGPSRSLASILRPLDVTQHNSFPSDQVSPQHCWILDAAFTPLVTEAQHRTAAQGADLQTTRLTMPLRIQVTTGPGSGPQIIRRYGEFARRARITASAGHPMH